MGLSEMPLLGLKLRDRIFRRLVLLKDVKDENEQKQLRRQYWLKLNRSSRIFLTPFGTFDVFCNLYGVDKSVTPNEFLCVLDEESFHLLEYPEWTRKVLLKSYIAKVQNERMKQREIECGNYRTSAEAFFHFCDLNNEDVNMQQFRNEQLSV